MRSLLCSFSTYAHCSAWRSIIKMNLNAMRPDLSGGRPLVSLVLLASLLIISASSILSGCEPPCVLNSQCSSSELCVEGKCLKSCENYYQCATGEACVEGTCRVPPAGYCESRRASPDRDGGPRLACEPPDRAVGGSDGPSDADIDEGRNVNPMDEGVGGEESGDMDASVSGEPAGMTAGETAGETAGDTAGNTAGDTAGDTAGETAGVMSGVMAGDLAGEVMTDLGVAGEALVDMGRPVSLTPWLYTSGPNVYQTGAQPWVGRGVNLHDTRSCDSCTWIQPDVNEVLRRVDEVIDNWGATLVRLNLESYALASGRIQYRPLGEDRAYLTDLERIVHHIGQKRGVYVVLSLWRDPSLSDDGLPTDQTLEILRLLVRSFYDAPQVIFSVSPGVRQNDQGALNQSAWESMNNAVAAIRDEERTLSQYRHLIAVPGLRNRGSDLSYYIENPITSGNGENILYETHIFQPQSTFDTLLVSPAQTLPVIIGSFGPSETPPQMMTQTDAIALIQEAERLSVSWAAWTFHMRCVSSAMLVDETNNGCGIGMALRPTEWGMAILAQLGLH